MSLYSSRPSLDPKLHPFDLKHNHFMTMDFGYLYPIDWQECVPGDVFECNLQGMVRCLPMVSPILNNITCKIDAFFVPSRILWKDFEKFFTTIDNDTIPPEDFTGLPPVWGQKDDGSFEKIKLVVGKQSIWNHIGLNTQLGDLLNPYDKNLSTNDDIETFKDFLPLDFLRRAYYEIWNNWYRDQNFQEPFDYTNRSASYLLRRAWSKDYFTASLYSRQKGTSPSIPITGIASTIFNSTISNIPTDAGISPIQDPNIVGSYTPTLNFKGFGTVSEANNRIAVGFVDASNTNITTSPNFNKDINIYANIDTSDGAAFRAFLEDNRIDLSQASTFDVSDLRDMFAIQRQMEGLMIFGSRFIEVLQGMYGTSPSDSRLQIPERLGSFEFNVVIDEVVQTSQSTDVSPQGQLSGHGLGVSEGKLFTYKCEEPGWILILGSIMPPAVYKNRFPRELFRKTRLEQYSPYFVNLSFQAINNREIFGQLKEADNEIWAYQGRYDEMRERQSYASGQILDNLSSYVSTRNFDSLPAMNSNFIACDPDDDIFAVTDEDKFICNWYIDMNALRPIPPFSIPGLIDHVYGG